MNYLRRGFTLIEIVVVIAILGLFMGLIGMTTTRDQRSAAVRGEAEQLAAVLRRTRHMAIADRKSYAVVFNIQNEPGSSGAVLNNRSGGHWYRVLGPGTQTRYHKNVPDAIPWAGSLRFKVGSIAWTKTNFPDFSDEVSRSWIGNPIILPAKKVRFLALGDTDEGPASRSFQASSTKWYAQSSDTTYPRPYFGYLDPQGRLWPWGGYDPSKNYSGFYFEGNESDITGCRNPSTRTVNHDWDGVWPYVWQDKDINGNGLIGEQSISGEKELNWVISAKDEPRAVVNADWIDAAIVFKPDGQAFFSEWNRGRRTYANTVPTNAEEGKFISGINDRAKIRQHGSSSKLAFTDNTDGICTYDFGEVGHFTKHTGGWHITLAPDILTDRVDFPSAADAVKSMSPMWRVHIAESGAVTVFPVGIRPGALVPLQAQNKTWPATPDVWENSSSGTGNPLWQQCRLGYLHETTTGTPLKPTGIPITNWVDPAMLQQRVWWLK